MRPVFYLDLDLPLSMYVCDATRAGATKGDLKRPKLRLYGESGVECAVEGAQTDVQ
jgi:hypothetical protein